MGALSCRALAGPGAVSAPRAASLAGSRREMEEKVVKASLATYFHGITEEISLAEVGPNGLPVLRKLLADRTFPRRDNVVAFLGFLGGAEETDAILAYMSSPPASPAVPEEDRSLLLAPQSLGRIAFHGDRAALGALMGMTAHGSRGGLLARAATIGRDPASLRDDLLEMALTGLAYSGSPEARERLVAVSREKMVPASRGRSLVPAARSALQLFDRLHRPDDMLLAKVRPLIPVTARHNVGHAIVVHIENADRLEIFV